MANCVSSTITHPTDRTADGATRMSLIDDRDLRADPVVVFQHRHFVWLALLNGILLPAVIASLWGDFWGGLLYAGYVVRVLIWHVTFAINR